MGKPRGASLGLSLWGGCGRRQKQWGSHPGSTGWQEGTVRNWSYFQRDSTLLLLRPLLFCESCPLPSHSMCVRGYSCGQLTCLFVGTVFITYIPPCASQCGQAKSRHGSLGILPLLWPAHINHTGIQVVAMALHTGTCHCPLHKGSSMVHDVHWWDLGWTYVSPSAKTRGKQGTLLLQQKELVMVQSRYFHPLPRETIFIFVVNNLISSVVWSPMQPACRLMGPQCSGCNLALHSNAHENAVSKAYLMCWCWGEILWNLSVFWFSGWWTPSA